MCATFVSALNDDRVDYRSDEGLFYWPFCYLHGQAETIANEFDIFLADKPMPTEPGEYMFMLNGWRGIMIISHEHLSPYLGGRGYLIGDIEAEKHCRNPKKWR